VCALLANSRPMRILHNFPPAAEGTMGSDHYKPPYCQDMFHCSCHFPSGGQCNCTSCSIHALCSQQFRRLRSLVTKGVGWCYWCCQSGDLCRHTVHTNQTGRSWLNLQRLIQGSETLRSPSYHDGSEKGARTPLIHQTYHSLQRLSTRSICRSIA